ncbi:MAG TPA: DapH/DapD/GlmU-related protein [Chthoniobacterales bacterium]|jgi:putative colanic acid biosynthesis acetyltransferase WcaF|nr:DapH/DapD/GlmU-related protein [Chthoniobacterales bacterium]
MPEPLQTVHPAQASQFSSPWSFSHRLKHILWEFCWLVFCIWTPKPANPWRLLWLRLFGAKIHGTPFVHQRARVANPANLILHDRACLGDRANAYALGEIEIGAGATVAQEVYLSTGSHDFSSPALPLVTAKITIGADAFIGARAFILPGVEIGARSVVGACSVVTRDVPPDVFAAGNPCKILRPK